MLYAACRKGSAVVAFSDIFTVALAEFVVGPDRDRDTVEGNDELIFFFFKINNWFAIGTHTERNEGKQIHVLIMKLSFAHACMCADPALPVSRFPR